MTFDGCTFNSSGKVINVYTDYGAGKQDITVNFKDCTVNNTGSSLKPVLNINDSNMGSYKYILNISGNNKVSGVDVDNDTCSRLFGYGGKAATNNKGNTVVNINDVTVWENGVRAVAHDCADFNTGSYDDGINTNETQYTDGYKDNAFSEKWGAWTAGQDGKLHRTGKRVCNYCGYSEDITDEKDFELDVSRSKTATDLDDNYRSTVTLSLPSAEEPLSSDIVFVMDTSDCVGEVMGQVAGLVQQLKDAQASSNADIKVGVVAFKGSALPMFGGKLVSVTEAEKTLTEMIQEVNTANNKEDVVLKYLNADEDFINKGSNLHAGLMAAKQLLASDQTVLDSRKYVVAVTDGMTYYWNDNQGNVYGIYSSSYSNGEAYPSLLFYGWQEAYGIGAGYPLSDKINAANWNEYIAAVRNKISDGYTVNVREAKEKLGTNYSGVRFSTVDALTAAGYRYVSKAEGETVAHGIERSVVECLDTYQEMIDAGYQCYTLNAKYGTDTFPGLFTSKLNEIADKTAVDFNSIQNKILYAVGAGSTVEDKIGDGFSLDVNSFKLTVGGAEIPGTFDATTNTCSFGINDNGYARFTVAYDESTKTFVWTINENVSNFAPVQLSYTIKLDSPATAAGTYEEPTNKYATLVPKDSVGNVGKELSFPVPIVSYTISGGGSSGGGGSSTYYYFAIEKVDAQDSHTLNGAKFGLYLDSKQIATATSNRSGIATFRVDESDYRKITTKSDLYYQELTAPEGYVVSSDKIDIEKSDLTTSQTTAEKNAETVRNYRSSTPDLLNDDDHFAYVIGYKDGYVRPYGLISRAETTTIFFRLLKDSVRDGNLLTSNTYTDVPDNYWANTAISTMTGLGIVQGRSSTTFDPKAPITRAQFAAICARFDTGTSSGTQTFSDISGHWAEKYIQRAAELGWIKGFEDGTFRPDTYITRAQAMTMINRVLNRIPEENSDLLSNMNVWPDCNTSDWFYLAVQEATNSHNYKHKAGNYETWISMKQDPDWTRYEN
ncbi:MAG: S-layer homology domain-containing protein [Eubacteriales bacterium]|nr:S-layer homology domain-containing protein [Eubacteriales bacterium]